MHLVELEKLEYLLRAVDFRDNRLELLEFINLPSKRLRPKIIFLILKMLGLEITEAHMSLALATELLHSATLIHDDIIDDADERRGKITTSKQFGTKPAVLGGDYLLSLALVELSKINNPEIIEIFAKNIKKMVESEIDQYFKRGVTPTLEEYLNKNVNKTALLFLSGVQSALLISNFTDEERSEKIKNFTLGFGLAFQILNDLKSKEDQGNMVYTIRDIFDAFDTTSSCDIIVKDFLKELLEKNNRNLDFADNEYKRALCDLIYDTQG